ncbi:MAG: CoA transferase [Comamonadaceae bacterium]|nr:MAG: CoA transferase [Comamonadaceae bacterium]
MLDFGSHRSERDGDVNRFHGPDAAESQARAEVATRLRQRDGEDWLRHFAAHDVCVAPVLSVSEMLQDPHVRARGLVTEVRDGDESVPQFASALRLSGTPATLRRPAPYIGEHTTEVLRGLGLQPGEIDGLLDERVAA